MASKKKKPQEIKRITRAEYEAQRKKKPLTSTTRHIGEDKAPAPIELNKKETTKAPIELNKKKTTRLGMLGDVAKAVVTPSSQNLDPKQEMTQQQIDDQVLGTLAAGGTGLGIAGIAAVGTAITAHAGSAVIEVSKETMVTVSNKIKAEIISKTLGTFGKTNAGSITVNGVKHSINKIAGTNIAAATKYAVNPKTISLTKKLFIGAGISLGVVSIAKDLFGTYPFASFGKEETLQSVGFVMNKAIDAGLYEEAQGLLNASNEIVNAIPTIAEKIPYANVQKEFQRYIDEQSEVNKVWAEIINQKAGEASGEIESEFARERREGDEAAAGRKEEAKAKDLEDMQFQADYFKLIREKKYEEAEELLAAQG